MKIPPFQWYPFTPCANPIPKTVQISVMLNPLFFMLPRRLDVFHREVVCVRSLGKVSLFVNKKKDKKTVFVNFFALFSG